MNMKENYKGKKVLVVGMGRSGLAAVDALIKCGASVSIQDSKKDCLTDEQRSKFEKDGVKFFLGAIPAEMSSYDALVVSPGVPIKLEFIQSAVKSGVKLIGELELAYEIGKGSYVAITGTNGKTTTTTLVGEIFKESGRKTEVVGNIGLAVASKAPEATDDEWLITETSSFQLETIEYFRPKVSAILNLAPDHLDRHGSFENYIEAKARIFENQLPEDYVILNADDEETMKLAGRPKAGIILFSRKIEPEEGAFVKDGIITIKDKAKGMVQLCGADELIIPGAHNLENALAAAAISYFAGIEPEVIAKVLRSFRGVEHRIEDCGEVNGVKYVNDSKGTNPDAAIKALQAIDTGIILIAGGYDKGSDFTEFVNEFGSKVKQVVLLGKTAVKIKDTAEKAGYMNTTILGDMESCVAEAARLAKPGDTVLLSPACASWDMYDNYEIRGEHFKECVEKLRR